uniref:Small ubiquitin like modifier 3 n=1 Tax=Cyprinus carpio TaxID=7962 RepID=A0A8C2F8H3_CYPCA
MDELILRVLGLQRPAGSHVVLPGPIKRGDPVCAFLQSAGRTALVLPSHPHLPGESYISTKMSDEKAKEGVKTENDHINLKVAGQDGSVVQFKIKRHTPLSKLMKAYCERQGLSIRQIRFRFDGQPINETDTPAQLEMEDEDTIDVFQQQTGGTC